MMFPVETWSFPFGRGAFGFGVGVWFAFAGGFGLGFGLGVDMLCFESVLIQFGTTVDVCDRLVER